MTTVTTDNPVRADLASTESQAAGHSRSSRQSRSWGLAGIGAAVTTIAAYVGAGLVNAVYDPAISNDADKVLDRLGELTGPILVFQVAGSLAALLIALFAFGLHRRLRDGLPSGSLLPGAAAFGLLATSVVMVMGTSLNTEFAFGVKEEGLLVPEAAVVFNHWIGTVPGCWILVGISALAVHAAARQGAVPRWLGRTGLVLGGLTVLVGVLPIQYMAGATGVLWLLVTAIGFTVGDKAHRAA